METSSDSLIHIQVSKKARGKNTKQAKQNANFKSLVKVDNNTISFNEILPIDSWDKWRNQEEKIFIQIPEGQKIQFNQISQSYPSIGMRRGLITPNQNYYNLKNEETYIYTKGKLLTSSELENKRRLKNDSISANSIDGSTIIDISDGEDANVKISADGINIKDGDESNVDISTKGINIQDGEESVNINFE